MKCRVNSKLTWLLISKKVNLTEFLWQIRGNSNFRTLSKLCTYWRKNTMKKRIPWKQRFSKEKFINGCFHEIFFWWIRISHFLNLDSVFLLFSKPMGTFSVSGKSVVWKNVKTKKLVLAKYFVKIIYGCVIRYYN